ncbi:MAG: tRNA (cytidine(56)-2'-O)-methyltransferase [Crenarchaeota archaeon]|nr:tRNA (cytidine(56)-2'-O)-methyltransferase [Thermoproteota archaeon]
MKVYVLRIGHRPERDKRITTHVGLVARAFGASGFVLSPCDEKVLEKLREVEERWGRFLEEIACTESPKKYVREWKGKVVHLTMYGIPVDEVIDEIRESGEDLLVVVGAEKVPPEFYEMAHYNVAIGNQPHSEVAALAVFLDRLFQGEELRRRPAGGRLKIVPSERGKRVVKSGGEEGLS